MIFWDASALIPLLIPGQPRAEEVAALLEEAQLRPVVWWGTAVECESALAREERSGRLEAADPSPRARLAALALSWDEVPPADEIREAALLALRRHPLRAADALQLGAALYWCERRPAGRRFCSLDQRLNAAAIAEGFSVIP